MNRKSASWWLVVLILVVLSFSYGSGVVGGTDFWTTNGPFVGAVYDLEIDTNNPNIVYAAIFQQKAIFKSNDYGASWQRMSNGFGEDGIHSVAVDSNSTNVLYAVGFNTVYKSIDGGLNWSPVLQLPGGMDGSFGGDHDILVSKRDANVVVVIGEAGIYLSNDAGANWENVWSQHVWGSSRRLFIGAQPNMLWAIPTGTVLQSTDEGQTWQEVSWPEAATSMAFDPTNENIIYLGTSGRGILKSVDGGDTWQAMYTGNLPTTGVIKDIVFHSTNPDIIFVAYSGDTGAGVYRSIDRGQTWTQMNDGMGTRNVGRLVVDDNNPLHLHAGTSVGVYNYTATTLQPADYSISINNGAVYCSSESVTITLTAPPNTTGMQISNDGSFSGAQWEPFVSPKPWTLVGYGDSVVTRVAYARFRRLDGTTTCLYMDDIILDTLPPTGTVNITETVLSFATAVSLDTWTVTNSLSDTLTNTVYLPTIFKNAHPGFILVELVLKAEDDLSGVGEMLISHDVSFTDSEWEAYVTVKDWWIPDDMEQVVVYVKFRDKAGNESKTYSATSLQ